MTKLVILRVSHLPNAMAAPIDIPQDLLDRAAKIRLVAFDVDGTLTDGRLWLAEDGREIKAFHVHDGLGIKLLRAQGIEVAIISARISHAVELRAEQLGIDHVYQGTADKLACLRDILDASGLSAEQAAYVGDDLPDLPSMRACGLAIAVADARPEIVREAHWQTRARGGKGAAREVCDLIVAVRARLQGPA
jgi:3-deoxy-D-manno-octulosonate 8-phosphate phosphatase (KDO 8-P phosphatase)